MKKKKHSQRSLSQTAATQVETPSEQRGSFWKAQWETFLQVVRSPKNFLLLVLFDLLFIASFYFINNFFARVSNALFSASEYGILARFGALLFMFLVIGLSIFVYSFFKYCVLDILRGYFEETVFTFKNVLSFFWLNILLSVFLFVVSFVFQLLYYPLSSGGSPSIPIAIIFSGILIVLSFVSFWYVYFCHILFLRTMDVSKQLFLDSYNLLKDKLGILSMMAFLSVVAYTVFASVFALIGLPLREFFFTTQERIIAHYGIYSGVFTVLTILITYLILQYHRLAMFKMVWKKD